jgi:NAD-dependent deacetylase
MEREGIDVPYCDDCQGPLKCATIAFGQSLPADVLEQSFYHTRNCDLFITIGSSLVVHPAAMLPVEAKQAGARLALINMSATPYDRLMDVIIMGMAGPTMDAVMGEYRKLSTPGFD